MIINSLQIDKELQLIPFDLESIQEVLRDSDARIWIDLEDFEPSELEAWLDKLNIQDLSRRLCLEAHDRPGFYPLKKEIFLVIPVLVQTESSKEQTHIAFLFRENLLLTFHQKSVLNPKKFSDLQQTSDAWLPERSIAGLVSAMMIQQSQTSLRDITKLRKKVFDLEKRMDHAPEEVEAEEITGMRSDLLDLGAVVSDQLPSLQSLHMTDKPFFKLKEVQSYIQCALVNLQTADKSLDWLDGRIDSLYSGFQMHAQDKTNRRLNMLTILSAIFTPMTFLAGIWGMNFKVMPELEIPYGYFMGLGLMAMIGWGMFFFLRKNGWFE